MIKVWDPLEYRVTMDLDLLTRISNQIDRLNQISQRFGKLFVKKMELLLVFRCEKQRISLRF